MDKIGAVLDTSGKVIDALSNTLTDIEANKSGNSMNIPTHFQKIVISILQVISFSLIH